MAGDPCLIYSRLVKLFVVKTERDMLRNLSCGGARIHPTIIRAELHFAVLQVNTHFNMPLNRSVQRRSGQWRAWEEVSATKIALPRCQRTTLPKKISETEVINAAWMISAPIVHVGIDNFRFSS